MTTSAVQSSSPVGSLPGTVPDDSKQTAIKDRACCTCCSERRASTIAMVAFLAITIIGAIFLISILQQNTGNMTPFFSKVRSWVKLLATKLETTPFNVSLFVVVMGGIGLVATLLWRAKVSCEDARVRDVSGAKTVFRDSSVSVAVVPENVHEAVPSETHMTDPASTPVTSEGIATTSVPVMLATPAAAASPKPPFVRGVQTSSARTVSQGSAISIIDITTEEGRAQLAAAKSSQGGGSLSQQLAGVKLRSVVAKSKDAGMEDSKADLTKSEEFLVLSEVREAAGEEGDSV